MKLYSSRASSLATVVIGQLGTTIDRPMGTGRWRKWRPTVNLNMHDDMIIDRYEILYPPSEEALLKRVVEDIALVSPETEVHTHPLDYEDPWDFECVYSSLLDWCQSYSFQDDTNYLVHITTGTHVSQICLFLLMEANFLPGKMLQTMPPRGPRHNNPGDYRLIDLDLSKYDRIWSRFEALKQANTSVLKGGVQTQNSHFNRLIDEIELVAMRSTAPILITGPTGAGKSRLARLIYALKRQGQQLTGPLVEVNCATLRGDSAMSALFGHTRGAFTGAIQERKGLLNRANGGLLFLDEVGELGLDEQAMLLRAIEEKSYMPVGSDQENTSDFQLICGSNRPLTLDAQKGHFREDLLARINLWSFELPGLKDRPEDIEPNLDYELDHYLEKHGRQIRLSHEARQHYLSFAKSPSALWKANFRDLNASVMRMATLSQSGRISRDGVDREVSRLKATWPSQPLQTEDFVKGLLDDQQLEQLDYFDRLQLNNVIQICRQSPTLSIAGRTLFQYSRTQRKTANDADRLRKYLQRFALTWGDVKPQG